MTQNKCFLVCEHYPEVLNRRQLDVFPSLEDVSPLIEECSFVLNYLTVCFVTSFLYLVPAGLLYLFNFNSFKY